MNTTNETATRPLAVTETLRDGDKYSWDNGATWQTVTRPLAEQIAVALLTPHGGPEGTRLAIKLKRPDGTESDLGGNCKQSVIDTVNRVLAGQADEREELIAALKEIRDRNAAQYDHDCAEMRSDDWQTADKILTRLNQ